MRQGEEKREKMQAKRYNISMRSYFSLFPFIFYLLSAPS